MKQKIKLTESQEKLIRNYSNIVINNENRYYFLPYWFEYIDNQEYILHKLGSLPKDLLDAINTTAKTSRSIGNRIK